MIDGALGFADLNIGLRKKLAQLAQPKNPPKIVQPKLRAARFPRNKIGGS
jgi:hypothetical protein